MFYLHPVYYKETARKLLVTSNEVAYVFIDGERQLCIIIQYEEPPLPALKGKQTQPENQSTHSRDVKVKK